MLNLFYYSTLSNLSIVKILLPMGTVLIGQSIARHSSDNKHQPVEIPTGTKIYRKDIDGRWILYIG